MAAPDPDEAKYENNAAGWARRYEKELSAAEMSLEKWHKQTVSIGKEFLMDFPANSPARAGYFTANMQTQRAMLFGKTPSVDVSREFADQSDDVSRVGGEMLERALKCEMRRDGYEAAVGHALSEFLRNDMGQARVVYEADTETVPEKPALKRGEKVMAEAVPAHEKVSDQRVEFKWIHHRDFLWNPSRIWEEVRLVAFRNEMSRDALTKRFGAKVGGSLPLNAKKSKYEDNDRDAKKSDPWGRAEIWEVWDKDRKTVAWHCRGWNLVLDEQKDPYGLEGFFPCPRPLLANATEDAFIPRPEYVLTQDKYRELNELSMRLDLLTQACAVKGVYNGAEKSLEALLSKRAENEMVPVTNWALFAEKGGLKNAVDWFPLEMVVATIGALTERQQAVKQELFELTGWSDIMRGQGEGPGVTAAEQKLKARFASTRLQAKQDEVARFATDLQNLKAQLVCSRYDAERIIQLSNVMNTPDAQTVGRDGRPLPVAAVELLKSDLRSYRVRVGAESIAQTDFAALQSERGEALTAMTQWMQMAGGFMQVAGPSSLPFLLDVGGWYVSGLRGAANVEGMFDKWREQAEQQAQQQAQQPQQQNPDVVKEQAKQATNAQKAQLDQQKEQNKLQTEVQKAQIDVQAEAQKQELQTTWNLRQAQGQAQLRARERAMNPPPAPSNGVKR